MTIIKTALTTAINEANVTISNMIKGKSEQTCPAILSMYTNTIDHNEQELIHLEHVKAKFEAGLFTRKDSLLAANSSFNNINV